MSTEYFFREVKIISQKGDGITTTKKIRTVRLFGDEDKDLTYSFFKMIHPAMDSAAKKTVEKPPEIPAAQNAGIKPAESKSAGIADSLTFLTNTFLLRSAQNFLTADANENLLLISGMRHKNTVVLSHMLKCKSERSMLGINAEPRDVLKSLLPLEKKGYGLDAIFHSHPDGGVPSPSSVDLHLHRVLENHGYKILGAVFTKTAVRFFTCGLNFNIIIGGTDYEHYKGDPNCIIFKKPSDTL